MDTKRERKGAANKLHYKPDIFVFSILIGYRIEI